MVEMFEIIVFDFMAIEQAAEQHQKQQNSHKPNGKVKANIRRNIGGRELA